MRKKMFLIFILGLVTFTKADSCTSNCVEVFLNYKINENILHLDFEFTNLCDKSVYFINNLWLFEFADDFKFILTSERDEIRFNRMYFFQDTTKFNTGDIVEEEMSKFNFNDIYQVNKGRPLLVSFRLKLTSELYKTMKNVGFNYKVKLVFSYYNWNNFIKEDIIKPEILTIYPRFNYYGYSNSEKKSNYLQDNSVFLKTIEGKLEFNKK